MNTNSHSELSKCHKAPVKLSGGVGDFSDNDRVVTMHYICTKCNEACDLFIAPQDVQHIDRGPGFTHHDSDNCNTPCDRDFSGTWPTTMKIKNGVPVCPDCGFPISEHNMDGSELPKNVTLRHLGTDIQSKVEPEICEICKKVIVPGTEFDNEDEHICVAANPSPLTDTLGEMIVKHDQMLAAKLDDDEYFKAEAEYFAEAKAAIELYMAKEITQAIIDELISLDANPQMFGDWQQVIEDRLAYLNRLLREVK